MTQPPAQPEWGRLSAGWYDAQHEPRVCELCDLEQGESQFSQTAIDATGLVICARCVENQAEQGACDE